MAWNPMIDLVEEQCPSQMGRPVSSVREASCVAPAWSDGIRCLRSPSQWCLPRDAAWGGWRSTAGLVDSTRSDSDPGR